MNLDGMNAFTNEVHGKLKDVDVTLRTHEMRLGCAELEIKDHNKEIQLLRESDAVQNSLLKQLVEETRGQRKDSRMFYGGIFSTLLAFFIWYVQQVGM